MSLFLTLTLTLFSCILFTTTTTTTLPPPSPSFPYGLSYHIDCGSPTNSTDQFNTTWLSDRYFSGGAATIVSEPLHFRHAHEKTLRFFPISSGKKNCYTVPSLPASRYLLRTFVVYDNYDGKSHPPSFDVSVAATVVFSWRSPWPHSLARDWRLRGPLRHIPLLRSPNLLLQPRHRPAGYLVDRALRRRSGLVRRRRRRGQRNGGARQLRATLLRVRPVEAGVLQRLRRVRPVVAVRLGVPDRPGQGPRRVDAERRQRDRAEAKLLPREAVPDGGDDDGGGGGGRGVGVRAERGREAGLLGVAAFRGD
ncbi:senescence-induced receptor-like serine/threonine-protein kinase [Spatholobus suberectus]|nr:senescence-induced receptor-like serine/threonine-protein kinase [Spatholobus suberectus]